MSFSICMDSPILTLIIITLLLAFNVRSQQLPDPQPHQPPESQSPSPPSPPPPSLPSPPRPPPPSLPHHPPLSPRKLPSPAARTEGNHNSNKHLRSPPQKGKTNMGKKLGLMFVGIASILQVCILAFLLISRRLLFRTQNGYQRN